MRRFLGLGLMQAKRLRTEPLAVASMFDTSALLRPVADAEIVSSHVQGRVCIGTHSGSFHCDESLAVAMLKLLPAYHDAAVVRTRDEAELAKCDIVVDVGAVYDAARLRFDHHQRGFEETLDGYSTKLSSAGLIYKHFGREVLAVISADSNIPAEALYDKMYKNFMEEIDAIDNGIEVAEGPLRYKINTTLSQRAGRFNPSWNQSCTADDYNRGFQSAMLLTITEFVERVRGYIESWWPARSIVATALTEEARLRVHRSGQVILLEQFCPWQEHLFELEKEMAAPEILYCLYQDSAGSWRIQAVAKEQGSFESRKKLPEAWRGLRNADLSQLLKLDGCIFAHAAGFIGGHETQEGVIQMAAMAMEA